MAITNACPNPDCGGELTDTGVRHCDPKVRPHPCGWIRHRACGAVVDPRRGRYYMPPEPATDEKKAS